MLTHISIPWHAERQAAIIVDIGGGIRSAIIFIVNKFPHLHLKIPNLPTSAAKFHQVNMNVL
jgi:hypothetical protein